MGRLRVVLVGIALISGGCASAATPGPATSPAAASPTQAALVASAAPSALPVQPTPTPTAAASLAVGPATPAPIPTVEPTPTAKPTPTIVPSATPSALDGTWAGTWQDTTPDTAAGGFQLTWARKGTEMTGTITVKGTPCLSGGTVNGTLSGDKIAFGAVSGRVEVSYTGTVAGNHMSGTYTAANCGEARGSWEATHK